MSLKPYTSDFSKNCIAMLAATLLCAALPAHAVTAYVRVNQLGYETGTSMRVYLMTSSAVSGVRFAVLNSGGQTVVSGYDNSGLSNGMPVNVEAVGYEIDNYDPTVGLPDRTQYTILANSPFVNFNNVTYIHNSSIYRGSGGNWIWATGSMDWSWTLSPGGSSTGQNNVRPEMQTVTRNILNRMIQDAPDRGGR